MNDSAFQTDTQELQPNSCKLAQLRNQLAFEISPGGLVGRSTSMRAVHNLISKAVERNVSVLILGETGTGKELAARCIHNSGPRKHQAFISVDCACLTPTLIESELFGHLRGAFTGADKGRMGLIEVANGGTLFLDEIGELPLALQSKLLRVIQEREVRRVGSTTSKPVDFRVIVATHRDLACQVSQNKFRQDLYYRLNVFPIEMPPLRARPTDIPLLVAKFLEKHSDPLRPITGVSEGFWKSVMGFGWPGNVRELENYVQRCVALGSGPMLETEDGLNVLRLTGQHIQEDYATNRLDVLEKQTIQRVVANAEGDIHAAARILGIGRTTIYRKLRKYAIDDLVTQPS